MMKLMLPRFNVGPGTAAGWRWGDKQEKQFIAINETGRWIFSEVISAEISTSSMRTQVRSFFPSKILDHHMHFLLMAVIWQRHTSRTSRQGFSICLIIEKWFDLPLTPRFKSS